MKTSTIRSAALAGAVALGTAPSTAGPLTAEQEDITYGVDVLRTCQAQSDARRGASDKRQMHALCLYNARIEERRVAAEADRVGARAETWRASARALEAATDELDTTFRDIIAEDLAPHDADTPYQRTLLDTYGLRTYMLALSANGGAFHDRTRHKSRKRGRREQLGGIEWHRARVSEGMQRQVTIGGERTSIREMIGTLEREAGEASDNHWTPALPGADNPWMDAAAGGRQRASDAVKRQRSGTGAPDAAPAVRTRDIRDRLPTGTDGFTGPWDDGRPERAAREASLTVLAWVRARTDLTTRAFCAFHDVAPGPECRHVWGSESCVPYECLWEHDFPGVTLVDWLRVFKKERYDACLATEAERDRAGDDGTHRPKWLRSRCQMFIEDLRNERGAGHAPQYRVDHRGWLGQEVRLKAIGTATPIRNALDSALAALGNEPAAEGCTQTLIEACGESDIEAAPPLTQAAWMTCDVGRTHTVCDLSGACAEEEVLAPCMRDAIDTGVCASAIEQVGETRAQRGRRCAHPSEQVFMRTARDTDGINAGAAAATEQGWRAFRTAIALQPTTPGGASGNANVEPKIECAQALVEGCMSMNEDTLWTTADNGGLMPWDRCPSAVRGEASRPTQTACMAAILENSSACLSVGASWESRQVCWPPPPPPQETP